MVDQRFATLLHIHIFVLMVGCMPFFAFVVPDSLSGRLETASARSDHDVEVQLHPNADSVVNPVLHARGKEVIILS